MLAQFKKHLLANFPEIFKGKIIIALSGGVDSIVLCYLFNQLDINIIAAHCNFHLRDKESDADTDFVKNWTKKMNIECFVKHFDTQKYSKQNRLNTQLSARQLRYEWFEELRKTEKADFIVTAHHADDNLETFLINLSRGTGIRGLTGIPPKNLPIIRPLLPFPKEQIVNYANQKNLAWREDSSNQSDKYLRNKIRHHITDELKKLHPTFLENFNRTLSQLQQNEIFTNAKIAETKNDIFKNTESGVSVEIEKLKKLTPLSFFLYELFSPYGFTNIPDLHQMMTSTSGKELVSKSHRLIKHSNKWIISKIDKKNIADFLLEENVTSIDFPIKIRVERVTKMEEFNENHIYVDADVLKFPLKFRHWKKSDYFRPFGMKGAKKLSKFFKDEKYSTLDKEKQWLLCSDNEIVWVVGKRSDERFKVTKDTINILKITYLT